LIFPLARRFRYAAGMTVVLNLIYLMAITLASPWLSWRRWRTGRYRSHLAARLRGHVGYVHADARPVAWFHGVSVGEIHLLATIVAAFRVRHPGWQVVISSTTDTGLAEAQSKFAGLPVIAWPFDFSWAIREALDRVRPSLLVLAEGELWPNTVRIAHRRGVRVAVVNARLSPRSARRYSRIAVLARSLLFRHIDRIGLQTEAYRDRFLSLGLPATQLTVTGSVKYDGAVKPIPATAFLRAIPTRDDVIWVAGSTHAPEERIVIDAFCRLKPTHRDLRLILVPRHPDRFGEVASLLTSRNVPFVKRSELTAAPGHWPDVLLLDTIGELGAAWSIATIGYVGGSLDGIRGGQSMIEPAGVGVPTVFGPHVWNFRDAAETLVAVGGAIRIPDADSLPAAIHALLADRMRRQRMGHAAKAFVERQRGATERTIAMLDELSGDASLRAAA
jgi:3-deoxy-D-manno-octulosonic-acid transferase